MKESIKTKIKLYLTEKRGWVKGGLIEDYIRQTDGHKASNASRRCRELEDEGVLEPRYVSVPGVPNKVVEYRLRQLEDIAPIINKAGLTPIGFKSFVSSDCCAKYALIKIHAANCIKMAIQMAIQNGLF